MSAQTQDPARSTAGWTPLQKVGAVLAWLWAVVPFGWGLYELIIKIPALFS